MLSPAPRPSPAFHYLPDKDSFLAQLLKSHYHLPKALCLVISISKNFSSKTSLCVLPEFALYVLLLFLSGLAGSTHSSLSISSHHSQRSGSNSASSRKPSLATFSCDSHFLFTLIALRIIPSARYLSYPVRYSYISFVAMTFAFTTIL